MKGLQENEHERIASANEIIGSFIVGGFLHKYRRGRTWRLGLCTKHGKMPWVTIQKSSGALGGRYGRLGMGGTQALAVGQLVLWIRMKPRRPIEPCWRYWASKRVMLCGERTIKLLRQSSYGQGAYTLCVLCGRSGARDWWYGGRLMGPCCSMEWCNVR